MRNGWCVAIFVMAFAVVAVAGQRGADPAAAGEEYAGIWSGTWSSGSAGGGFDLTLEKAKDGTMSGKVAVTGDPTYNAVLKSVSFEGKKMTAKYDFPPNEAAEVILTTTFDGNKASGTWSLRAKGTETDAAAGTLALTRK